MRDRHGEQGTVHPRHEPLSAMLADGLGGARLQFGHDTEGVRATELERIGRAYYSPATTTAGVGAILTNDAVSVALLLGAISSGARLVSLPIPSRTTDISSYAAGLRGVCNAYGLEHVVVQDSYAGLLAEAGVPARAHSELSGEPLAGKTGEGFELVQFSSGSTGEPKPIALSDTAIGANLSAILEVIDPRPGDNVVSWLPLSHDMGLVGMLLCSLVSASPRWVGRGTILLLDPLQFLRRPSMWLRAIGEIGGSITAAPDFGYRLAMDRADPDDHDLSTLRFAIVGGEAVRPTTLHGFSDAFRGAGFRPEAFCPAYGMAEVGLAISLTPGHERWTELTVRTDRLAEHVLERVLEPTDTRNEATTLVSSGRPLVGYELRTSGSADTTGDLEVRGPSIGADARSGKPLANAEGWMSTGDMGAIVDGQVFITGRSDDYFVTHGRNIHAPSVESAVETACGVRSGKVVIIGLPTGDWVVVAEPAERSVGRVAQTSLERSIEAVVIPLTGSRPTDVLIVGRGQLPVTPSGKLQRPEVRRRYLTGELEPV